MKTIRKEVFETNSSSTHSITIGSKIIPENPKIQPLVENGVLFPDRLNQRETYIDIGYDSLSTLVCSTRDEKAAILCHWLRYKVEEEEYPSNLYYQGLSNICLACGYNLINDDFEINYYPHDDDYFVFEKYSVDGIICLILDDNIKIMDQTIPY